MSEELIKIDTKSWKSNKIITESAVEVFVDKSVKTYLSKIKAKKFPTVYDKLVSAGFRSGKHLITLLVEELGKGIKLILCGGESKIVGKNVYVNFELYEKLGSKKFFPIYTQLGFSTATEFLITILKLKVKPRYEEPKQKVSNAFISTLPRVGKYFSAKKIGELSSNLATVIKQAGVDAKRLTPEIMKELSAAAKQSFYREEVNKLDNYTKSNFLKQNLQKDWENKYYKPWFAKNNWVFGIDYKGPLGISRVTTDCTIDIGLVTYDNYIDVIEVKTPNVEILEYDNSHDNYYASKSLASVISQAIKYIQCLEFEQSTINAKFQKKRKSGVLASVLKPRVRIIIGHEKMWPKDERVERKASLRLINDALANVQILTFDQILQIAGKMIANYE